MTDEEEQPISVRMYQEIDDKIQAYVRQVFLEQGIDEDGDYVGSWALVVHYNNLGTLGGLDGGYMVDAMPSNMPPHALKGLLGEGVSWVKNLQEGRPQ